MADSASLAPEPWHAPNVRCTLAEPTRGLRRALKIFAVVVGTALQGANGFLALAAWHTAAAGAAALCCLGGLCAADFVSGLVHWAADTYGSANTPIFGGFVSTFRVHHTDPADITRHDPIEANADVFTFSAPVHAVLLAFVHGPLSLSFIFGLFLASYPNSQLHKWAHLRYRPAWVSRLQALGVLLSPERHARHHAGRHDQSYCITTGWLNPLLDRTRFFRGLEWLLARLGIERTVN